MGFANSMQSIDPLPKRHRLVHSGGFPKFEALCYSLYMVNSLNFRKKLVTRYNLPDYEVSNQFKVTTVFEYIRHYGPVILLLCLTT